MKSTFWFFVTWFCIATVTTAGVAVAAINIDTGDWHLFALGILICAVGVAMALGEKDRIEEGED